MPQLDDQELEKELIRDEGLRLKPYYDIVGKLSIGIGRNLTDCGISEEEAHYLLWNDIGKAEDDLDKLLPWWRTLTDARQRALVNMTFNLGIDSLMKFDAFLAALKRGDWDIAAREMLASKWAMQVGERAVRLSGLIKAG